jgi:hypothetical protein
MAYCLVKYRDSFTFLIVIFGIMFLRNVWKFLPHYAGKIETWVSLQNFEWESSLEWRVHEMCRHAWKNINDELDLPLVSNCRSLREYKRRGGIHLHVVAAVLT